MYRFMKKNKGAISVFLVIVLVPMLVVSSVFVDMGRINLAKAVADSSGELTLNTALTNYDAVLKDMYGLFATSQNTDELFAKLEQYYLQCIESAGVAEPDAEDYVSQIMQLLKSESGVDDLLNMNLTSFEVTKQTGGHLANPAVLKSQLVEFMKYRGPIELGSGIFDALTTLKNLKKQTELVDNKNKFYQEQTNIMEKLEYVWNLLENYQYRDAYGMYDGDTWTFPEGDYLSTYADLMEESKKELQTSVAYVVRYLYYAGSSFPMNESGVQNYGVKGTTLTEKDRDFDQYEQIWEVKQLSDTKYYIQKKPEKTAPEDVEGALQTAYAAIQALKEPDDLVKLLETGNNGMTTTDKIKTVSKFTEELGTGYSLKIKKLVMSLTALANAKNGCEDDLTSIYVVEDTNNNTLTFTDDSKEENKGSLESFINTQLEAHLTMDDGHIQRYNANVSRVQDYWKETKDVVKNARVYMKDSMELAQTRASTFSEFVDGKIEVLNCAIGNTKEGNAIANLKVIYDLVDPKHNPKSDYCKALEAWTDSANELKGETIGDNDLSEINKLSNVLTTDSIRALLDRLDAAIKSLRELKTSIDSASVFGHQWKYFEKDLSLVAYLEQSDTAAIKGVVPKGETAFENIDGVSATYDKAYEGVLNGRVALPNMTVTWENDKSPDLRKNQVKLYTWLYNNFCDTDTLADRYSYSGTDRETYTGTNLDIVQTQNVKNGRKDTDDPQTEMEKTAATYNDMDGSEIEAPDRKFDTTALPSGEWGKELETIQASDKTDSDSEAMLSGSTEGLGFLDGLLSMVGNMATDLRDDLYIASYIMNMFSYSTYEAEIAQANGNTDVNAFDSWYTFNASESRYDYSDTFSTYTNRSEMKKDARTLTKVSVNPNSNYLYGKEVEYIIFGDAGVAKTYGSIYLIRFALNTVYAFTDAEISNMTTAAATALFGTPPLTPLVPVAKIAMTIGISLAESAYDLYQLKCGAEVPLMKNSKTWVMKPSSAGKVVLGTIADEVTTKVLDEGEKLLNKALAMTDEELKAMIDGGGEELRNLAYAAKENIRNEIKNYGNQAIQEAVRICNEIMAFPLTEDGTPMTPQNMVDKAVDELRNWLRDQGSSEDDVVYLTKKTVVEYLTKDDGCILNGLFEALDMTDSDSPENKSDELGLYLNEILDRINSKLSTLIEEGENALHQMSDRMMNELSEAAHNGVESFRSTLKEQIGSAFGTTTPKTVETGTNNVVASLLSWTYSDYLQLFLLTGLVSSQESVLLRTADVIELNMQLVKNTPGFIEVSVKEEVSRLWGLIKYTKTETKLEQNPEAFKLSKSYTYLSIKATIEVKPLMLTLPLMAPTVKSQLDGAKWYEITYEGTLGY